MFSTLSLGQFVFKCYVNNITRNGKFNNDDIQIFFIHIPYPKHTTKHFDYGKIIFSS